jgi:hypothetical protein
MRSDSEGLVYMTPSVLGCPTTVFRVAHYNPHETAETDKLWSELRAVDSGDNLLTARSIVLGLLTLCASVSSPL